MQVIATEKRHQNRAVIDPWTVVHFGAGLAMGLVNAPFKWSVAAAVAYEFAEQYVERSEKGKEFFDVSGPEALPNAVVDLAVFAAGHALGQAWNRTK